MTDLHTAAKQALEALEFFKGLSLSMKEIERAEEAIAALRKAQAAQPAQQEPEHIVHSNGRYSPLLTRMMNNRVESNVKQVIELYDSPEQPAQQEPVAWLIDNDYTTVFRDIAEAHRNKGANVEPLYTSPPAQQCKWPTCQSEEYQQALAEQIKRELVGGQPAQQEPVKRWVWVFEDRAGDKYTTKGQVYTPDEAEQSAKILGVKSIGPTDECVVCWPASPPAPRKPLTDGELADIWYKQSLDWMEFARAIEAAHNIKENT